MPTWPHVCRFAAPGWRAQVRTGEGSLHLSLKKVVGRVLEWNFDALPQSTSSCVCPLWSPSGCSLPVLGCLSGAFSCGPRGWSSWMKGRSHHLLPCLNVSTAHTIKFSLRIWPQPICLYIHFHWGSVFHISYLIDHCAVSWMPSYLFKISYVLAYAVLSAGNATSSLVSLVLSTYPSRFCSGAFLVPPHPYNLLPSIWVLIANSASVLWNSTYFCVLAIGFCFSVGPWAVACGMISELVDFQILHELDWMTLCH